MRLNFLVLSLILLGSVYGQSAADAAKLFNERQYEKAKNTYGSLLKKRPKDALYNYRYARCCYELKEYETSIEHFEISGNKYPLTNLYLGELYFETYRFTKSVDAYQQYIASLEEVDERIPELQKLLQKSETAEKLMNRVEDIAIVDSFLVNKNDILAFYQFSNELGKLTQKRMKFGNSHTLADKISYTTQRGDRTIFSDSLKGNMDIFSSYKLLDEWSAPVSVSKQVNTVANENYPFLMLDGVTLYFASDGEGSIGGYDIFMTRYNASNKDYYAPENVGFPFNSPANDYMLVIDEPQNLGWFATDRNQQNTGKVMIYEFKVTDDKKYIRSDDDELVRNAAMLRTYRKAKLEKKLKEVTIQAREDEDVPFTLVMNDSTVYNHFQQFRSTEALEKCKQWVQGQKELTSMTDRLNELREQYASDEQTEDKEQLTTEIIATEKLVADKKTEIQKLKLEATNTEIKFLDDK
ncbi:MAG: hypothetical protein PHH37_08805 [Paludibacter sp.]|nr:hypothetical protein [Paludibacter sp.]